MKQKFLIMAFVLWGLCACKEPPKEHYAKLLQEWIGKDIRFPATSVFTSLGKDTVCFDMSGEFKLLTYMDSAKCISCQMQLNQWEALMDETRADSVRYLFFFSPEHRRDILGTLKSHAFTYPVCIDETKQLAQLNHFPAEFNGQSFLLDKDNRVLAIGNPVRNLKVKELYLKIIRGEDSATGIPTPQTTVRTDRTQASLGHFGWQQPQTATFTLTNTGSNLLAIEGVDTSCSCISVQYDPAPVRPGGSVALHVTYTAEQPGHFRKTVTVHCNAGASPLQLTVDGEAT